MFLKLLSDLSLSLLVIWQQSSVLYNNKINGGICEISLYMWYNSYIKDKEFGNG